MTKISYTNKVDTVTNPSAEPNKVTADDLNEIKSSVNSLYDSQGWIRYRDTVNDSSNKQVLTESIDNTITIVDLSPIDTYKPAIIGSDELWTGNKITPYSIGDSYLVRLDFKASIDNVTGFFDLKVDIDGLIGSVYESVNIFPKGRNVEHVFSYTFSIYTLDTFVSNGGNIFINPSHEMLIWDKAILITRIFGGELFELPT